MSATELYGGVGMKAAMTLLDDLLTKQNVSSDTRAMVVNSFEMMWEYVPYAISQGKNPSDKKVLAQFLANKGSKLVKYLGNDSANCAIAMVDFLLSAQRAGTTTGALPLATLAYGLAVLDLIEVGNSCEFAQIAYYEAFIRESSVKIQPIRQSVMMMKY